MSSKILLAYLNLSIYNYAYALFINEEHMQG